MLQVISENWTLVQDVEQAAQQEMSGYLKQRYIIDQVFTNTTAFDLTTVYYGKNLVYLTGPAYNDSITYAANSITLYEGIVYYNPSPIVAAEDFNDAHWTALGADGSMFYVALPENEYNHEATYVMGDVVWYADRTYTAKTTVTGILPTNSQLWTAGAIYSVSGVGTQNPEWSPGDNRNQLVVMRLIDITLFHIHSRISPRNIPDLRKERYDGNSPAQVGGAIGWLKQIAHGDVNVDLPEILPVSNLSMNWGNAGGSNIFSPNTY